MKPDLGWINDNCKEIVNGIAHESIAVYFFLQDEYDKGDITSNHLFQFVYRSFYRIDNAGLTIEFKDEYFSILEASREATQLEAKEICRRLYDFENHKRQKTLQFSFATKLMNTVNPQYPIYDSKVATVYGFKTPTQKPFDDRCDRFQEFHTLLSNSYEAIMAEGLLRPTVEVFRQRFGVACERMPQVKILDFIMWSTGKVIERRKRG